MKFEHANLLADHRSATGVVEAVGETSGRDGDGLRYRPDLGLLYLAGGAVLTVHPDIRGPASAPSPPQGLSRPTTTHSGGSPGYPRFFPSPRQGGLPIHDFGPLLRRGGPPWWFLGAHGGAGTSTLHAAVPGGADAGHWWPVCDPPTPVRVVLVTRSHAHGLRAAQVAAWQWTQSPKLRSVHLLGLAVIADAPGRRPKPLRDLLSLISGGVPKVWDLPWVEAVRLGDPPEQIPLPPPYAALAADLHSMTGGRNA